MTILEVGERVWRYTPTTKSASRWIDRKGHHWADSSKRYSRIYLIVAFIAVDVAIFWFGLSMSGLTVNDSATTAPRALPLSNGAVLGSTTSSPRPVLAADLALAPLVGASPAAAAPASSHPVVTGSPVVAQSSPGGSPSAGGGSATTTPATSALSPPKTGQPAPAPAPAPGPALPLPGLPSLLPAVGQTATHTVTGLVDVLAPVVQGVDTTLNTLRKPAKLPLLGGK
jgi:hypothetical protein